MSKKSVFHQVVASHIFILAGFLLVLNHSACNCQNPKYQDEATPKNVGGQDDTKPKGMHLVIQPVGCTQLAGGLIDRKITFHVYNMITNGDPVNFTKLKMHITTSDAMSHVHDLDGSKVKQLPNPNPGGSDLNFNTIYTLILHPHHTATQVIVELQLFYDNKKLETTDSKCTFTWESEANDVTKKLFKALDSGACQEALDILRSPERSKIQSTSFYLDGEHEAGMLLNFLHVPYRNDQETGKTDNPAYKSLIEEILSLPHLKNILINPSLKFPYPYPKTPLEEAIEEGNLVYMDLLVANKAKLCSPENGTTILHKAVSHNYCDPNLERTTIQHILTNYPDIRNAQDNDGNTALHIAIKHRADTIVAKLQQLRAGGVDHMLANKVFQTPLAYLTAINATTPISNFEALKAALQ